MSVCPTSVSAPTGALATRMSATGGTSTRRPHDCESDGSGNCKHCGAEEPPPWPTRTPAAEPSKEPQP